MKVEAYIKVKSGGAAVLAEEHIRSLSVNRVETPAFQAGRFNSNESIQVGQGGPPDDERKSRSAARTG